MKKLLSFIGMILLWNIMLVAKAEQLSPTFLPMLAGSWQVNTEHSVSGQSSATRCFTVRDLQSLYTDESLLRQVADNPKSCRISTQSTRNSITHFVKCDERKLITTEVYRLTKEAYNKYVLERSVSTTPYTPSVNSIETTVFTRLGRCSDS